MEAFKHYLKTNTFTVYTDHKTLQWIQNLKDPSGRLGRWVLRMQEFNFEMIHRDGKKNINADAISRLPYAEEHTDLPITTSDVAHNLESVANVSQGPSECPNPLLSNEAEEGRDDSTIGTYFRAQS